VGIVILSCGAMLFIPRKSVSLLKRGKGS